MASDVAPSVASSIAGFLTEPCPSDLRTAKGRGSGESRGLAQGVRWVAAGLGGLAWSLGAARRQRKPCCCPRGALRAAAPSPGTRRGEIVKLPGGLEAYVVGRGNKRAVVVASDIFGIHMGRHKEICDSLADEGFLVVLPDFFKGVHEDPGANPSWWDMLRQAPTLLTPLNTAWGDVERDLEASVLPFLQDEGCAGNAGILGFCWGAWVVAHGCARFDFRCGAMAHPSVHNMTLRWGENEEALLSGIRTPQLVLASKDEPDSWKPGGLAERVLEKSGASAQARSIFKEFPAMSHGFVPRGDLKDGQVASDVARAMEYIQGFLCRHLPRK